MVLTGLDVFLEREYKTYQKLRLGVLCNQASLNASLRHISESFLDSRHKLHVTCFLGPQHGIRGEKQDNMVESEDFIDPITRLPVYSLYSGSREPHESALEKIDAFVVDLQDIGSRVYTFVTTMAHCMEAAKRAHKKVIVLDRPNPVGGIHTEGNVLEKDFSSFVGKYPICVRHGMTIGELALLFNEAFGIGAELEVVRMRGWKRQWYWEESEREWVLPSPNIASVFSAIVFSGSVFFEGTNISEGRGTTRPFEMIGAPFINPDSLAREMKQVKLPGVYFRPIYFQPTFQKWKDEVCGGVHIHVLDRKKFNSFRVGLYLLEKIATLYPSEFQWKKPPYEYEHDRMPIDLIAGTSRLRKLIDSGKGVREFETAASGELEKFRRLRGKFLIY